MIAPRAEMDLFDAMHPRCRAAIANAPFDFRLVGMPLSARHLATSRSNVAAGRFIGWLEREVEAVRQAGRAE